MKKNVFITGVTGTMGMATLKEFVEHLDEFNVRVLARDSECNRRKMESFIDKVNVVWGDLTDDACLKECVRNMDYVLHIGSFVSPMADAHPKEAITINYGSTLSMLKSIKELGQEETTHFVYVGSVSMYGDRQPPIHWGRVGDPMKPSILDHYALSKVFSERAVIDSGLRYWASVRQTAMLPTNPRLATDGYPIGSHVPLNNVAEWSDYEDSARLMFNICSMAPENFWRQCYNIGGGAEYRKTQMENDAANKLDKSRVAETNWYALYNHHCMYFLDSDHLNELVPFRAKPYAQALMDSGVYMGMYFKENNISFPVRTDEEKKENNRKNFSKWGGTLWALEQKDSAYMKAFYGSEEKFNAIPSDWETRYKNAAIPEGYNSISYGFDTEKPVEELWIEDMRQAAEFRGGVCLSENMNPGDIYTKLKWRCAQGHEFEATPYAVLFAGHWCEDCIGSEWRYGAMAQENPFFAQVWLPHHAGENNYVVKTEFDPREVKKKYE